MVLLRDDKNRWCGEGNVLREALTPSSPGLLGPRRNGAVIPNLAGGNSVVYSSLYYFGRR